AGPREKFCRTQEDVQLSTLLCKKESPNEKRSKEGVGDLRLALEEELWAPPDSGSAHRRIAGLYRVPTLDPSRSLRRPRISFPPPLPHRRTSLLATGKNSAAPKRTFSSPLASAGCRAQRDTK